MIQDAAADEQSGENGYRRHEQERDEQRRDCEAKGDFENKRRQCPGGANSQENTCQSTQQAQRKVFHKKDSQNLPARGAERAQEHTFLEALGPPESTR